MILLYIKLHLLVEITKHVEADAFLFCFQLDTQKMKKYAKGVYLYEFNCDYNKFQTLEFPIHTCIAKSFIKCNICSNFAFKGYKHKLFCIDVEQYLSLFITSDIGLTKAYENAKQDYEWLLLPLDPMLDGIGYQSRIPLADFWNVELYKYVEQ